MIKLLCLLMTFFGAISAFAAPEDNLFYEGVIAEGDLKSIQVIDYLGPMMAHWGNPSVSSEPKSFELERDAAASKFLIRPGNQTIYFVTDPQKPIACGNYKGALAASIRFHAKLTRAYYGDVFQKQIDVPIPAPDVTISLQTNVPHSAKESESASSVAGCMGPEIQINLGGKKLDTGESMTIRIEPTNQ